MRFLRLATLFLVLYGSIACNVLLGQDASTLVYDPYYREDQFYLGSTYNFWTRLPEGLAQRNFSYGVLGGFIRDMPINLKRTISFGFGLGYGYNNYYSNLRVVEEQLVENYVIVDETIDYKRNKLVTHTLEFPLELRWRSSNPSDYSFWRMYAGFKMGYNLVSRSKFVTSTLTETLSNRDIESWQYGLTFSAGYNAFTLHLYYGLNSLFDQGIVLATGSNLEVRPLRFGLIFYIL